MMSRKTVADQIRHYQKDIERCPDNSERMLRCIQKLYTMPVQVQHLQETGIGRSVNSLRKYSGEVGDAAKALVAKWKAMVAAEESSDESIPNGDVPLKKAEPEAPPPPPERPSKRDKPSVKPDSRGHGSHENGIKASSDPSPEKHKEKKKSVESSSGKVKPSQESRHHSKDKKESSRDNQVGKKDKGKEKYHDKHSCHSHKRKYESDSDESPDRKRSHHSKQDKIKKLKDIKKEESSEEDYIEKAASDSEIDSDQDVDVSRVSEEERQSSEEEEEQVRDSSNESVEEEEEEEEEIKPSKHHKKSHNEKSSSREKASNHKSSSNKKKSSSNDKSSSSHRTSSHSKNSSSKDLKELIKENEKKVKQEKLEKSSKKEKEKKSTHHSPSSSTSKVKAVKVKVETNEDGSIDNECGASFGDALMGCGTSVASKKKKKPQTSSSSASVPEKGKPKKKSKPPSSSGSSSPPESPPKKLPASSSKHQSSFKEPDLLSKKPKMEPLELDISSTLPEINPNYKPLPYIIPDPPRRHSKTMSDEETMFSIMTTKNQRTKVYSGYKKGNIVEVPSLYSLCIKLLHENIEAVEYTGGVPYDLLEPLLKKLTADQLYMLEHYNPYLIVDTGQLWEFHCKKDFRSARPVEMESWRDLYLRCMEERERKLKALTENITQSIAKSTPVRQAKLAYVDTVAKPPRNIARKQAKYGTGGGGESSSSPSRSEISNKQHKQEIVTKAVVGGHTPGIESPEPVPPPPAPRGSLNYQSSQAKKKKKAPLMAKALQLIKGFKR